MWEAIKYELSIMDWRVSWKVFLAILLVGGSWIYVPLRHARYRVNRKRFEQTFDAITTGQILFIRKLHQPAGEDGRVRLMGYQVHYTMMLHHQLYEREQYIPKTVDLGINQQIRQWMNGDTKALIRYQTDDPHHNTLQLIDLVY